MKITPLLWYLLFLIAGFATGLSVFCLAYSDFFTGMGVIVASIALGLSLHASYAFAVKLTLIKGISSLPFVPYMNMAIIAALLYFTELMSDVNMLILAIGLVLSSLAWWIAVKLGRSNNAI